MLIQQFAILALTLVASASFKDSSGTGAGNGGDPIFSFLETTRYVYLEAIKSFGLNPAARNSFCESSQRLSTEQKNLCRAFVEETVTQLLDLNATEHQTEFVLRQEPLLVKGPDGQPMPVAARTELGAKGTIEFHRSSVQHYSPPQMLFLLAHEFGHKVIFRGHALTDNEHIGAFATGRELLDSAAEAIVTLAESRGQVGKNFGVRDFWQCQIHFSNGGISDLSAPTMRLFFHNNWDQYESGVSRRPDDPQIAAYETLNTRMILRIRIRENLGCLKQAVSREERETKLEIIRVRDRIGAESGRPEEIMAVQELPLVNPICEEKPRWLELSTGQITFRCLYSGSQGGFQ